MRLEANGKLHAIFDTRQVSARFQLREFVVEMSDNPQYPQYVMFQMTGTRCDNLDDFSVGQTVNVEFNLRGREWKSPQGEIKYFNSLDCWTLQRAGDSDEPSYEEQPPPPVASEGR